MRAAELDGVRFHDLRHTCAVYSPPTASVHYDAALKWMGMRGEVPVVVPVVEAEKEVAPEPEGPEAASRQGGGGGIRGQGAVRRLDTEHARAARAGVKAPQSPLGRHISYPAGLGTR